MSAPLVSPIPPFTVSIVEDEEVLREELAFQLEPYGFSIQTFADAPAFYRYMASRPLTVAVLDIGLEGEDGLSVCQYLREFDLSIGIVFMTARGLRDERLTGLAAGADAYLVKPVDVDELALILQRLGERLMLARPPVASVQPATVRPWALDAAKSELTTPNGIPIRLSINELSLMRLWLLEKPGQICTHAELANTLGLSPQGFHKHRVEVIVSRLRERVRRISGVALPLQSERGIGYLFEPD